MIKARLSDGRFILGLDAINVQRLQAGQPIACSLAQVGGTDDLIIMFGPTLQDIVDQLQQANGGPLPPAQPLPPEPASNVVTWPVPAGSKLP